MKKKHLIKYPLVVKDADMSAFVTDTDYLLSWRIANGYCTETDAEVDWFEDQKRAWKESLRSMPQSEYAWRKLMGIETPYDKHRLDRDEIRERADFAHVLELYGVKFRRRGDTALALCPFHGEKTASMSVNFKKKLFNCMACGAKGDIFGFIMQKNDCTFYEALKELDKII